MGWRTSPVIAVIAVASGCFATQPGGDWVIEEEILVRQGRQGVVEYNLEAVEGAMVNFDWIAQTSGAVVDFNVHRHQDGVVSYFVNMTGQNGTGSVKAPESGVFSVMWAEPSAPEVLVMVRVGGDFRHLT